MSFRIALPKVSVMFTPPHLARASFQVREVARPGAKVPGIGQNLDILVCFDCFNLQSQFDAWGDHSTRTCRR